MSATGGLPGPGRLEFSGELSVLIARLIAEPGSLSANLERATEALDKADVRVAMSGMLETCGETLQISSPDSDGAAMREVLDAHFAPSDGIVTEREPIVPQLFVSDMDSTMITVECVDELADFAGLKEQVSEITERAMQGELDFEAALRERVGLLAGLTEDALQECLEQRVKPMPGAKRLVATLKELGCRTVLVTGGFHHFADAVAEMLGFDLVVANRLEVADGKLTGGLAGPIVDSSVKRATLLDEAGKLGEGAVTLASGDGANDIPMFEVADYSIAYHAKPKARAAANGWVDRGDLTSVLRLLGIPESDWVAG